jgi:hypothetical protein
VPKYERETARLVSEKTGAEIMPGDKVTTFRGEEVTFLYVSRLPEDGKEGKIFTDDRPGGEFYPSVIGAFIDTGRRYQVFDHTDPQGRPEHVCEDGQEKEVGPLHLSVDAAEEWAREWSQKEGRPYWSVFRMNRRVTKDGHDVYEQSGRYRVLSW